VELGSGGFLSLTPLSLRGVRDAWVDLAELPVLGLEGDLTDGWVVCVFCLCWLIVRKRGVTIAGFLLYLLWGFRGRNDADIRNWRLD
jgi:hypothetical protein